MVDPLNSTVPFSNSIPSLNVPVCSCSTLTTFSKVVSRIFVVESKLFTVPTWDVSVLSVANVPVISFTTKCACNVRSGGLVGV